MVCAYPENSFHVVCCSPIPFVVRGRVGLTDGGISQVAKARAYLRVPPIVIHSKISFVNIHKVLALARYKEASATTTNLFVGFSYYTCL